MPAATDAFAAGIEVIDSCYTDYRFTMSDIVADNAYADGYTVGAMVPVAEMDPRLVGAVLELGRRVVGTTLVAASLGHSVSAGDSVVVTMGSLEVGCV